VYTDSLLVELTNFWYNYIESQFISQAVSKSL